MPPGGEVRAIRRAVERPAGGEQNRLSLVGLLSLNDVVLEAAPKAGPQDQPTYRQIIGTMRAICEHRKLPAAA